MITADHPFPQLDAYFKLLTEPDDSTPDVIPVWL